MTLITVGVIGHCVGPEQRRRNNILHSKMILIVLAEGLFGRGQSEPLPKPKLEDLIFEIKRQKDTEQFLEKLIKPRTFSKIPPKTLGKSGRKQGSRLLVQNNIVGCR